MHATQLVDSAKSKDESKDKSTHFIIVTRLPFVQWNGRFCHQTSLKPGKNITARGRLVARTAKKNEIA